MEVKLARKRGFCFGVEDAIELAERTVNEHDEGKVIALGPVIHNRQVVERLEQSGLNQSGELSELPSDSTVLIRSHGAPPETFADANARQLDIVDATCVLVKKAQNVVKNLHEQGYQVVMIGDENHPEVRGVIGYAPNVIVVDEEEDLDEALPRHGKLGVVAQTTHAPEHVAKMIGAIAMRPFREIKIVNTLCLEVVRRQEAAVELCRDAEVIGKPVGDAELEVSIASDEALEGRTIDVEVFGDLECAEAAGSAGVSEGCGYGQRRHRYSPARS